MIEMLCDRGQHNQGDYRVVVVADFGCGRVAACPNVKGSIQQAPQFTTCVVVRGGIARRCKTIVAVTQLTALTTVVQLTTVLPHSLLSNIAKLFDIDDTHGQHGGGRFFESEGVTIQQSTTRQVVNDQKHCCVRPLTLAQQPLPMSTPLQPQLLPVLPLRMYPVEASLRMRPERT